MPSPRTDLPPLFSLPATVSILTWHRCRQLCSTFLIYVATLEENRAKATEQTGFAYFHIRIHAYIRVCTYMYMCIYIYFLYRVVFFLDAKVGKLFQFLLSHFMIAAVAAAFYLTNFPGKFTGIFGFVLFGFCVLLLLLLLLFLLLGCCSRVHGALWFISPVS